MRPIGDQRVLVFGASAGIGRGVAVELARRGARVAVSGRRTDRLEDLRSRHRRVVLTLPADVRDDAAVNSVVGAAAGELGGLDALIYAAGVSSLGYLKDETGDDWRRILETNVVGAALATAAAVPHLTGSRGVAIYFGSVTAHTAPWPGLGPYGVSKSALARLVESWRTEHPTIRFSSIVLASTGRDFDAELTAGWDPELRTSLSRVWADRDLVRPGSVPGDDVMTAVATILESDAHVHSVVLDPPVPGC